MKKGIIFLLGFFLWQNIYSVTNINFSRQLVVIYKVLNPLSVTVDPVEKMTVKSGTQVFRYSEVISSKRKIGIKVEAPYHERDDILDRVYGTATLTMQNDGKFDLRSTDGKIVKGRGFFSLISDSATKQILPLYTSTSSGKYEARTEVDAIFNEEQKEMKLGEYSGVLSIDVTYGE